MLILLVLLSITFIILVQPSEPVGTQLAEADRFAIADTGRVNRIRLQQAGGNTQLLEQTATGWQLNEQYKADPGIIRLMLSVLHNVQVKRSVAENQQDEVLNQLENNGTRVQVYSGDELLEEFLAGGEAQEKISYYADEEGAYVMELPGYVNYISGLFELSEANLRDRILLEAGYLNLQQASLEYPQRPEASFTVNYDGQLLTVADMPQPDSTRLFNWLSLLEALPAVGYVDARAYPELDSLLATSPVAELEVKTSDRQQPFRLQLFAPLQGQAYRLGLLPEENETVMLDERLAQALLLRREALENDD